MNTQLQEERINEIIDMIDRHDSQFNMARFLGLGYVVPNGIAGTCGTSGCIAGFAYITSYIYHDGNPHTLSLPSNTEIFHEAQDWLGLSYQEASSLFIPALNVLRGIEISAITAEQAIQTLERYRDTHVISWSKTLWPNGREHCDTHDCGWHDICDRPSCYCQDNPDDQ